jgi:predicted nucleic acid-binding protein
MSGDELYFVDTNVLLYAQDPCNIIKRARARDWIDRLWRDKTGRISWQVLHEYYVNAVRKMGVPPDDARQTVMELSQWRPVETNMGLIQAAWHWMDEAHLSYWDALIVAAAQRAGCRILLSEDMQPGRDMAGVEVLNPFVVT